MPDLHRRIFALCHSVYIVRFMNHLSGLQLLGYAASILIATSLLMRSIVRLRLINMAGAATFSVYGFLIGAYPVAALNLMTTAINIVQLVRLQRRREIGIRQRRVQCREA